MLPVKNISDWHLGLLHGCDYNPDQWLDRPDILQKDIELMQKAKINCVSLGVFAWSTLEPSEGVYNFDWMEKIIDALYKAGVYTILSTPTGALPPWLAQKYPEVLQTTDALVQNQPGNRHNFCWHSPVMRQKAAAVDTALAKRFGRHEGVMLWHISNELAGTIRGGACYCEHCQAAFRQWLKNRYKTLDALNKAWWTPFWSHTYTDWSQLHSPVQQGETLVHGLNLDWKRFTSDSVLDWYRWEVEQLRPYSDRPAVMNMMGYFKPLDYRRFADTVDCAGWDAYPYWHQAEDDVAEAVKTAAYHSVMRSLKKQPFLLMEATPSVTNWQSYAVQKRPGFHELTGLQTIAMGGRSVQYFQWRQSRGGCEKFHGAVLSQNGSEDTRIFKEVAHFGETLQKISPLVENTCNVAQVAILFDWQNWWALEDVWGPKSRRSYVDTIVEHYRRFWEMGIDVDFVEPESDLSGYQLVIAPELYMLREQAIENLKNYVRDGGTYLTGYWSNLANDTDLCYIGENPMQELLGIWVEEQDVLPPARHNRVEWLGKGYDASDFNEVIHLCGAESMAAFTQDYYAGSPALTRRKYGRGCAYYLAASLEPQFQTDFYTALAAELGLGNAVSDVLPDGVTVSCRQGKTPCWFVQNFTQKAVCLPLKADFWNALTGQRETAELTLPGYGTAVLRQTEATE